MPAPRIPQRLPSCLALPVSVHVTRSTAKPPLASLSPSFRCAPCDLLSSLRSKTLNHASPSLVMCLQCIASFTGGLFFWPAGLTGRSSQALRASPLAPRSTHLFRKGCKHRKGALVDTTECTYYFPPFLSGQMFLMITFFASNQTHLHRP